MGFGNLISPSNQSREPFVYTLSPHTDVGDPHTVLVCSCYFHSTDKISTFVCWE